MCYLVAKDRNAHGCFALKTTHGKHLVELKRELNREVGYKGVQLVTISRPTAYGEYAIVYYFSLSPTLVLFPFFLCGVCLREFPEFLIAEPKRWMRVLSGACVIGCTAIVWHYYGQM